MSVMHVQVHACAHVYVCVLHMIECFMCVHVHICACVSYVYMYGRPCMSMLCVHVCVCVCSVCECLCLYMRGVGTEIRCLPQLLSTFFLRQDLSLNLDLT